LYFLYETESYLNRTVGIEGFKTINVQRRPRAGHSPTPRTNSQTSSLWKSLECISSTLRIDIETVQLIIAKDPMHRAGVVQQFKTQDLPQLHEDTLPTFIYSYTKDTDQLHRTSLVTGEHSSHQVPSYRFKYGCCWSEVPGGSLIVTGGGLPAAEGEVERIDTCREFAVGHCPPMHFPRVFHAAVYHTPHLYLLGGWSGRLLRECERLACAEHRWEDLPSLPRACSRSSGVVVESSLYALGGFDRDNLDLVQKLSLESLTWELMQLKLPMQAVQSPASS
jgi:hypothetical protein